MQVGWYELPTAQWIRGLLQRGSVAADIGAHIGYFTHAMSIEVGPGGHVFAFEPSPENFSLLQRNVARAGLANAACSQLAVADRTGAEPMYVSPGHSNHSLVPGYAESGETVQVNVTTLDAFLAPVKLGHLCLVKVDAEGAEPRILKGMRQTIESTPDLVLVIEINPRALECAGSSPDLLIDAIESSDLVPRLIDPDGGLAEPRGHAFDDAPNLLCMRQHMWDRLIQSQYHDGFSR